MKRLVILSPLVLVMLGAAATQPASFMTGLYKILGRNPGTGDPLPALAAYMKSKNASDLDKLALAILDAKPDAIRRAALEHTSLMEPNSSLTTGPYGTFADRRDARSLLWKTGKSLAKGDPGKAKQYCVAAILFYAMDDFPARISSQMTPLADSDGLIVAGISGDQLAGITKLLAELPTDSATSHRSAGMAIDRLIKHPEPAEMDKAIKAMEDRYTTLGPESEQLDFAMMARQLLNHAVKIGDNERIEKTRVSLNNWIKNATGDFRRWLTEALNNRGEPEQVYFAAIWKDGKWVDYDTDGK